jgi:glycosyltransferase involved in cell wall biosynthesis
MSRQLLYQPLHQAEDLLPAPAQAGGFKALPATEKFSRKVSAVIITFNEEDIIARTLSRLDWCDEIIIVDSGSTDRTENICREFGCSFYTRSFKGFGEQKSFGVTRARNEWILCLDADELVTRQLVNEIRFELDQPEVNYAAFTVPRNLVFMNRVFSHGRESRARITRLFNKNKAHWDGAVVHEKVSVNGNIKHLKNKLLHYSYKDYNHFINKINLYSTLGAKKLLNRGKSQNKIVTVLAIPFNFFKYFIIHRNFMNGYRGFAWSVFNTVYHFLKYLKLADLKRKEKIKQN